MKLYRTTDGVFVEENSNLYRVEAVDWDELISDPDLHTRVLASTHGKPHELNRSSILAPIGTQEVWAAGVTYFRSRSARIEESKDAGGGTFYDRVYIAERPELFFSNCAK